jgi:hypothetical protein
MYLAGQASVREAGVALAQYRSRWAAPAFVGALAGTLAASLLMTLGSWMYRPASGESDQQEVAIAAAAESDGGHAEAAIRRRELDNSQAWLDARLLAASGRFASGRSEIAPGGGPAASGLDSEAAPTVQPMTSRSVGDALTDLSETRAS